MKGYSYMAKIISELLIALLFSQITGYDVFVLLTICSYSIELYKGFHKELKKINKSTKDKAVEKATK